MSAPYIEGFKALRDKILEHKNHYEVHIMDSASHYNYEISSIGGCIVWDDENELLYWIHENHYQTNMVNPICIAAIPYSNIRCIEEFCEEAS